jgi:GalNAc-alpha-(1->4)-GalNAc-alpha-(1->3)-diNAcBac-PP-undecaprenol alpha-1,4-N-acetyl-D-galactosaminyltransferase
MRIGIILNKTLYLNKPADRVTVLTEHDFNYIGNRLRNKVVMPNPLPYKPIDEFSNKREKIILAAGNIIITPKS